MDSISIKNSAKETVSKDQMIQWIVTQVRAISNPDSLKYNVELLVYISSCLELACNENNLRVDKLECLINVYKELFEMSAHDEVIIIQILDFVHKNRLIKDKTNKIITFLKKVCIAVIPTLLS
jgi:hypothetical protein